MQETDLERISTTAKQLHAAGATWHFHILTPSCMLNKTDRYALILEVPDKHIAWVHYSSQAEKAVGQELSPLLHGKEAWTEAKPEDSKLRPAIQKMIQVAKEMNAAGVEWHHHVLYPGCRFNKNAPQFTLIVEDPRSGEAIESVSVDEPTSDLRHIEPLFYAQQK